MVSFSAKKIKLDPFGAVISQTSCATTNVYKVKHAQMRAKYY